MRNLLLLVMFVVSPVAAQDTVRVTHKNYVTVFDTVKYYPVFVQWINTKQNIFCKNGVKRADDFAPDPKLVKHSNLADDYKGSGFDRGHISPAGDNGCYGKEVMSESFYYTNMAPQYPGLNRGQWKALEDSTRQLAIHHDSVIVRAGCFGVESKVKKLSIPTHCWKTITVVKTKEHTAYLFPNVPKKGETLLQHKISIDSLQKLTKLKLN